MLIVTLLVLGVCGLHRVCGGGGCVVCVKQGGVGVGGRDEVEWEPGVCMSSEGEVVCIQPCAGRGVFVLCWKKEE